jgi:hypothetical protein
MSIYRGFLVAVALSVMVLSAATADTIVPRNTVIPVVLDTTLSSASNKVGDTFYAHHEGISGAGFPEQTRFVGKIDSVTKASVKTPGQLGVRFVRAELPEGPSVALSGQLSSLDQASVKTDPNTGRLVSTGKGVNKTKFIAYGAGIGLIIGELLSDKAALGAIIGAAAGYLYGQKRAEAAVGENVSVPAGTKFGVLLEQDASIPSVPTAVGGVTAEPGVPSSGFRITFQSLKPIMSQNELMLPFRYVMGRIGIPFDYDSSTKTIRVNQDDSQTVFTVGNKLMYVDGEAMRFSVGPRIFNGAVYVPSGYIEHLTGRTAYYSPASGILRIE